MAECLFCRMVSGAATVPKVAEGAEWICIRDIQPQATTHLLVISRRHWQDLSAVAQAPEGAAACLGPLLAAVPEVARFVGIAEGGYRCVINSGADAGQSVHHLHLHVLGGAPLKDRFGS